MIRKSLFLLLQVVLCTSMLYAQGNVSNTEKITSLCQVWGFLKYYHPAVAQGSMDWDKAFADEVDALDHIHTKEALNAHYIHWISSLGDINNYPSQPTTFDKACNFNTSLNWIDNNDVFSPKLEEVLKEVVKHRATGKNRFVRPQRQVVTAAEFTNEDAYSEMVFPAREYRLLALARYWNMIEYFFPYKYLTDTPWNNVLVNSVTLFNNAKDTTDYYNALCRLIAAVKDSHANFRPPVHTGPTSYFLPVRFKVFADKAIVTTILNDSLARIDDIRMGDVLLAINDTSVQERVKNMVPFIGASNNAVLLRNLAIQIASGKTQKASLRFDRDGAIKTAVVNRYTGDELHYQMPAASDSPHYKEIAPQIGYIDLALLKKDEVTKALDQMSDKKAIIFDMRCYPEFIVYDICNYLAGDQTDFVKFTAPDYTFPGKFVCQDPLFFGKKGNTSFAGKIIVLINEQTQSRAEFTTMALKALPGTVCIGSQTAGADGNAVDIVLPGNIKLIMSGLGVYYPDGTGTQRVGIKPDIYIEPSIEGIRSGKDEILDRAILYATTGR